MLDVDRAQVLAYRVAAHGLHRTATDPAQLAVFDLGVQDNQRDSVAIALTARLGEPLRAAELADDPRFVLAWSHRGAPHLHRADELAEVTATMIPLDEADAQSRLSWDRRRVSESGMAGSEALAAAARAVHGCVDKPMTKGAVSTAVTRILPRGLSRWCRSCQATHVWEQLLRLAALPGGARLERAVSPATLAPVTDDPPLRTEPDLAATGRLVASYLRLHGPATKAEVAGFIGASTNALARVWPAELAQVRVAGRPASLPPDRVEALANPPEPDLVRLLPPSDPFLQARDRGLLVPDAVARKQVWTALGNPGVVLAGGEIVGSWRAKAAGARLAVTVSPFGTLTNSVRSTIEDEADRVATARGYERIRVSVP